MAKYVPAWQRALSAALNHSARARQFSAAWQALLPQEQQAAHAFLLERAGGDEAKAHAMLEDALNAGPVPARRLGLIAALAAEALAAIFLPGLSPVLKALLLVMLFIPTLMVFTAKNRRMEKLWMRREPSEEGTLKALNAMYRTAAGSPLKAVNKAALGGTLLLTALVMALMIAWENGPEGQLPLQQSLLRRAGEVADGKADPEALFALMEGAENETDGLEAIRRARRAAWPGSTEQLLLTGLMGRYYEACPEWQLMSSPGGVLAAACDDTLKALRPEKIADPAALDALTLVFRHANAQNQRDFLTGMKDKNVPDAVYAACGRGMDPARTADIAECAAIIADSGRDALPFLTAAYEGTSAGDAAALFATLTAEEQALLPGLASAITDPDEVLAFLRLAKDAGYTAVQCYPQGALLAWDTTAYDPYTSSQAGKLGKRDTFLIVYRTEKPEPFTTLPVAAENTTAWNEDPTADHLENYDPDQDAGAAQFTVVLDTDALDRMPDERIPESLADCDVVVILDTLYVCDGFVRTSYYGSSGAQGRKKQVDCPTYAAAQSVDVYRVSTGEWLFAAKVNAVYSPAMQMKEIEGEVKEYYLAAPDEAWMAQAREDFLYSLERRNWALVP